MKQEPESVVSGINDRGEVTVFLPSLADVPDGYVLAGQDITVHAGAHAIGTWRLTSRAIATLRQNPGNPLLVAEIDAAGVMLRETPVSPVNGAAPAI